MKINITTTSQALPVIMGDAFWDLVNDRGAWEFRLTIQNLSLIDIYLENWEAATVDAWYKIFAGGSVEIPTDNLNKLNLIADWSATDVRIITT